MNNLRKPLTIFAPAKINLYLHLLKRYDNGYHEIDSLAAFADIGDEIQIDESLEFSFHIKGPYAGKFSAKECDSSPGSSNLVVKSVWALSRHFRKTPSFKVTLTKNLPLASGIGGGSADAAAAIWGVLNWWGLLKNREDLTPLMSELGADIPVCFSSQAAYMRSIGDVVEPLDHVIDIPIILVNSGEACSTQDVFTRFNGSFKDKIKSPLSFNNLHEIFEFLYQQENVLTDAASNTCPSIQNILNALNDIDTCKLVRLSGSGATCFGLFETIQDAQNAAKILQDNNPDWWIKSGYLNRAERY